MSTDLLARYDVPGPRYTSYPTAPFWTDRVGPADYEAKLREASGEGASSPLSIYVHLPFCRQMCTFCGCNVVIARDRAKADPYLDALEKEMALVAAPLGERGMVSQLHWGGGTPTFLSEAQIRRLWESFQRHFTLLAGAEVAIEVNPAVTTNEQISLLAELGFNRLSVGVQDFDPGVQRAINRIQGWDQTRALIEHARSAGFRGINTDLIYGLPGQRLEAWRKTVDLVLDLHPDRAVTYSFAYVPDVRPHQRKLDVAAFPSRHEKLELLRTAHEAFSGAGYRPIGMDHYALPEDELSLAQERRTLWRNFQGYTVQSATDVVAFGITGVSDVQGAFAQNLRPVKRYNEAVGAGRFATERGCILSPDDRRRRQVITQLMCNFWVDLGADGATYFAQEIEAHRAMERDGLLAIRGNEITLTPLGRLFVRNAAMVFDTHLRRARDGESPTFSRTI